MRTVTEILESPYLYDMEKGTDGFRGEIHIGGWRGTVIFTTGCGWEHASVSPYAKRTVPSWDDMVRIKDIFWKDDESVIQVHPPKDMYVNNMPNCLHLWRCTYKDMILPPSVLVGIRNGQTKEEFLKEVDEAYKMAGEENPYAKR